MQQEQIREQYETLNLTRINHKNRKLLRNLDRGLLQLNVSFKLISRVPIMLTYDKTLS